MKVHSLETFIIPAHINTDNWCRGKAWVLVKIKTECGIIGWGEAYVLHDCELSTVNLIHQLARYIDGLDPRRIKYFTTLAYQNFSEYHGGIEFFSAVSGIEIALWDIVGKALNTPVYNLLGGQCRQCIKVYANCWSHEERSTEQLVTYAQQQVALGFKAVKIYPFLYNDNVNKGIERLSAVRQALGDNIDILVDAWRVASPTNIDKISQALKHCNVTWFEDPIAVDNIELLAHIRQIARLPIVTGETICTKKEFRPLLEKQAVDILNPDITCCGILEIKELAAMAEPYYAKVAIHNYNSMAIALAASVQVAAVIPNFTYVEYFHRFVQASQLFAKHSFDVTEDGYIEINEEAGLGVSIDETALSQFEYQPSSLRTWPKEI